MLDQSEMEELATQDRLNRARRQLLARHPDCRDPDHLGCDRCAPAPEPEPEDPPPVTQATHDEAMRLAAALAGASFEWGEARGRSRVPSPHRDKEFERHTEEITRKLATEVQRLVDERNTLAALVAELEESSGYWSEYEAPLGIVERIEKAMKMVREERKV